MLKASIGFLAIIFSIPSQARVFTPLAQIGFDGGGDSLHEQSDQSDFDLRAGTGFFFSGGTIVTVSDTDPHAFEAQLTLSYKLTWDTDEDQGDVNWIHIPLELMYFYKNKRDNFRLGYGVSYYTSSKLEGEGSRSDIHRKYKNELGYILAIEKILENPRSEGMVSFGVRYNIRDFIPKDGGAKKNGNAFGLYITIGLP
ncbi:MAG: hypothetical protein KDD34_00935 [Bdellovibrionales bacterium]|nr:hypothetical protein [Bdellovibrionales bacterium]